MSPGVIFVAFLVIAAFAVAIYGALTLDKDMEGY